MTEPEYIKKRMSRKRSKEMQAIHNSIDWDKVPSREERMTQYIKAKYPIDGTFVIKKGAGAIVGISTYNAVPNSMLELFDGTITICKLDTSVAHPPVPILDSNGEIVGTHPGIMLDFHFVYSLVIKSEASIETQVVWR